MLWFSHHDKASLFSLSAERVAHLIADSTAVVCYNDTIALGLYEFCRGRGVDVPGDLSVVGIDDSKLATLCAAPLTSVRHPHQRLGEKAAETLIAYWGTGSAGKPGRLFEPHLVERESTAPPKTGRPKAAGPSLPVDAAGDDARRTSKTAGEAFS